MYITALVLSVDAQAKPPRVNSSSYFCIGSKIPLSLSSQAKERKKRKKPDAKLQPLPIQPCHFPPPKISTKHKHLHILPPLSPHRNQPIKQSIPLRNRRKAPRLPLPIDLHTAQQLRVLRPVSRHLRRFAHERRCALHTLNIPNPHLPEHFTLIRRVELILLITRVFLEEQEARFRCCGCGVGVGKCRGRGGGDVKPSFLAVEPGFEFGGAGIDQVLLFWQDAEVALGFGGAGFRAHVVDCEFGFDGRFGVTF